MDANQTRDAARAAIAAVALASALLIGGCGSSSSSSSSSKSSNSGSSSTYTYHDKSGTTGYIDIKGYGHYTNPDGTTEITDGYGNVGKDTDGDGKLDVYSSDSGKTWSKKK